MRVLIADARFYAQIADALVEGALAQARAEGAEAALASVEGAWELPQLVGARFRADPALAGAVALGCVIRGETSHYDIVAGESAHGLMAVALEFGKPVANGVLTVDNRAQALARAAPVRGDKGGAAMRALLGLIAAGEGGWR